MITLRKPSRSAGSAAGTRPRTAINTGGLQSSPYANSVIGDQEIPEDEIAELRERIRPEAERAVKRILIVDRIADTQDLRATEGELDDRIEEIADANETAAAKVYAELQKAGRLEAMERELTETKVFNFLKEQSEIIDAQQA